MKNIKNIIFLMLAALVVAQAQVPAPGQAKPVLITGATLHLGNGQVIENGAILFDNGKITQVGPAASIPVDSKYEVITAAGKHVYPGFIIPNTELGLVEISSVRATRDFYEVGSFNPNVRSVIAYNTDSELIPVNRNSGVLVAQVVPQGGWISGTSSVIQMDGWNWEDATHTYDDAIHMRWPGMFTFPSFFNPEPIKKSENYEKQIAEFDQFFKEAVAYHNQENKEVRNLKFEAMKGLFDGTKQLFVSANFAREIVDAVQFAQQHGVKKVVLVGGNDAWKITDFLKDNNIPVVLNNIHRLPSREDEDIDLPYKLPALLKAAGVRFCLTYDNVTNIRNLPFYAGTAATYGLGREEAVKAITLGAAEVLGVSGTLGSLEQGKDATLFISTGDALDMKTNNVEAAFIKGRKLDLHDKHKGLYKKFKDKYTGGQEVK